MKSLSGALAHSLVARKRWLRFRTSTDSCTVVAPVFIPISTILVNVKWYWERLVLHEPTCYKKNVQKGNKGQQE